jgi:hypothetical protein
MFLSSLILISLFTSSGRITLGTPLERGGQSIEVVKSRFPKVDFDAPEPQDPNEKARRRSKGKHFDNRGGVDKEPNHLSAVLNNHWDMNLPPLPVKESTAVVIAETLNRAAFLSNDKMAVYTELRSKG